MKPRCGWHVKMSKLEGPTGFGCPCSDSRADEASRVGEKRPPRLDPRPKLGSAFPFALSADSAVQAASTSASCKAVDQGHNRLFRPCLGRPGPCETNTAPSDLERRVFLPRREARWRGSRLAVRPPPAGRCPLLRPLSWPQGLPIRRRRRATRRKISSRHQLSDLGSPTRRISILVFRGPPRTCWPHPTAVRSR